MTCKIMQETSKTGFKTSSQNYSKITELLSVGLFCLPLWRFLFVQVDITETDPKWEPLWWFAFFVAFTVLNILGVKLSFNFELFFTIVSLLVLFVFYGAAIPKVDYNKVNFLYYNFDKLH